LATYPFSRASAGFATGAILTSTAANTIDDNAASGADGSLWTDVAIAKNWVANASKANCGYALLWSDIDYRWHTFGVSGGNPVVGWKFVGDAGWSSGSITAGSGLTPWCAATSSSIMVCGGTPGVASASKIRSSTDGNSWAARSTTASGTEGVRGLCWHSGGSVFIAGLDNTASTNIETSPDGITWTQITGLANTNPRGSIASNGTTAVILPYNTSTNKCLSTANGTTYTERTLPSTEIWYSVVWDSRYSRFIAFGATNFAYSSDGATWTAGGAAGDLRHCAVFGRVILGHGGTGASSSATAAHFVGTTLTQKIVILAGIQFSAVAVGNKQFMLADATDGGAHYWTIAGGDIT
jgi:hypothetical protein